jgi:hypothetical protein
MSPVLVIFGLAYLAIPAGAGLRREWADMDAAARAEPSAQAAN